VAPSWPVSPSNLPIDPGLYRVYSRASRWSYRVPIDGPNLFSCVFGLSKPSLPESLSGNVRIPRPNIESSDEFVDGFGNHLPIPHST
jgi:hypothetical protein